MPRIEALESRSLLSADVALGSSFMAASPAGFQLSSAPAVSPHAQHPDLAHHHATAHHAAAHPATAHWATPDLARPEISARGKGPRHRIVAAADLAPYNPQEIRHAYGFDQLNLDGAGQTIAIIDAYDDPTIANDLHLFDRRFGLPDPTLIKATPMGVPTYDSNWAGEIALDVEWAHAIAPAATILLVEVPQPSLASLLSGVDYAVSQGATQVSMSWTGGSFRNERSNDAHFRIPGVTFVAASGDDGAGASYPSTSPYVTAVGGTSLALNSAFNRIGEIGWTGSGGGTDLFEPRPSYQAGSLGRGRGKSAPDVAYNADPDTGYLVYDSSSGGGWTWVGGTSAGTPQWAGLVALVNQGREEMGKPSLGFGLQYGLNQELYALAGGSSYTNPIGAFFDVSSGNSGLRATAGYDRVTGLGSPNANILVPALIDS